MAKQTIAFNSVVFCEEIRREDNGKLFFVGVYPMGCAVKEFPAALNFGFWITGTSTLQQASIEAQAILRPLEGGKETIVHNDNFEINIPDAQFEPKGTSLLYSIIRLRVEVNTESTLVFRYRKAGGRWKSPGSLKITAPADAPTEHQQPS